MGKFIDLTGQRFGRLTVVSRARTSKDGHIKWNCLCDCGKQTTVLGKALRSEHTQSCSCIQKEKTSERNKKSKNYGEKGKRLYAIWVSMKQRIFNKKSKAYQNYGGRSITIDSEWNNDFQAFKQWAFKSGYQENLTIDRIDNDKGYYPDNCRWADFTMQANNKRTNRHITYNGETKTLAEWSRYIGINQSTLCNRLNKYGWSVEKALTTPMKRSDQ